MTESGGRAKGGIARAIKLSPARRAEIASKAAKTRWEIGKGTKHPAEFDPFAAIVAATGDDATREGLRETPNRVRAAFSEWFSGYSKNPSDVFKSFEDGAESYDELVIVSNIETWSFCEHHMAPFFGLAHIGYLPSGRILGLSKFARLIEIFSRRLQVQERLTQQICDTLVLNLNPRGVGVVLECRHLCMESRGARARGSITTTSSLNGKLKTDPTIRSEFLSLVQSASKVRNGI